MFSIVYVGVIYGKHRVEVKYLNNGLLILINCALYTIYDCVVLALGAITGFAICITALEEKCRISTRINLLTEI